MMRRSEMEAPAVRARRVKGARRLGPALGVLAVLIGGLALPVAPAQAVERHLLRMSFGEPGSEPGQFSDPSAVAVNDSNSTLCEPAAGDVYVVDTGNNRVERFSSAGAYLGEFNASGTLPGETKAAPTGELLSPDAIAVDNSENCADPSVGDVYVTDTGHNVVDKFSPTGEYITQLTPEYNNPVTGEPETEYKEFPSGLTVDKSGNLWVSESKGFIDEFGDQQDNSFVMRGPNNLRGEGHVKPGLAIDFNKELYVVNEGEGEVYKYNALGEFKGALIGEANGGPCRCDSSVAVDPTTNDPYVYESNVINEYGPFGVFVPKKTEEFGYTTVEEFGAGDLTGEGGVAVTPGGGKVYVTNAAGDNVDLFEAVAFPDVATGVPSSPRPATMTLTGVVNPEDRPLTGCKFEYGETSSYGKSLECAQSTGAIGAGESNVPVTANVQTTGLPPGTVFHYRLVAENGNGVEYGKDQTFVTPPQVEGAAFATHVTSFAATLHGIFYAGIGATPEYRFLYGLTSAYGQSAPVPNLTSAAIAGDDTVEQTISGLQPGTTYHFALLATNYGGGTTVGGDAAFTTRPLAPPLLSTGAAEGVGENAATLTGGLNPQGLATSYSFQFGTSTAYGSSWPNLPVPAGSAENSEAVSVELPNLQPGTTYHYRLVASNEDGTSYGADQSFTTPGYPVSVVPETPVMAAKLPFVYPKEGAAGKSKSSGHKHKKRKTKKRKRSGKTKTRHKQKH